jgi:hypothetical protein
MKIDWSIDPIYAFLYDIIMINPFIIASTLYHMLCGLTAISLIGLNLYNSPIYFLIGYTCYTYHHQYVNMSHFQNVGTMLMSYYQSTLVTLIWTFLIAHLPISSLGQSFVLLATWFLPYIVLPSLFYTLNLWLETIIVDDELSK